MKGDKTAKSMLGKRIATRVCSMSPIIIMIIVLTFFAVINGTQGINFLSPANLSVIINQACFLAIVGIGQSLVILTGGVNLSMGAVMAFTTVLWGGMLTSSSGYNPGLPVLLVLLSGCAIGLLNGLLVTKLKIPPFIATFAVMYSFRGLAWVYLRNRILYPLNENFRTIAMGKLFKVGNFTVTVPMLIAFLLLFLTFVLLRYTNLGRKIYFIGANSTAARFSGINVDRIVIFVYVLSCLLAAFAGLMYVARLNACEPGLATKTHFEAITVSLIGGFTMAGGYGNIWGVASGAIVVYTIQAGMNSLQMPSELQTLVNGVLIILAVFINQSLANKKMELDNDLSNYTKGIMQPQNVME